MISSEQCGRDAVVVKGAQGYILGNATSMRGPITSQHRCFYTVTVKPGQHINVYLHNFALHPSKTGPVWSNHRQTSQPSAILSSATTCSGFLTVEDNTNAKRRIDLCNDVFSERKNLVFTSAGSTVSLHHNLRGSADTPPVLISYEGTGLL